jgi:single-strand DNA-binding protein
MNLNQLTIIGYIGKNAETKQLPNGTPVIKFSVATREYDRTIQVPSDKKTIEHVIPQLVVELKADTVRLLDRSISAEPTGASELSNHDEVPS